MRIPIVNRFTCSYKQLDSFIKNIKGNNITPILDYANENYTDFNNNYKKTRNIIEKYPNNVLAIKLSSFNVKNDKNFAEKKTDSLIDLAIQNNSKILIDAENYEIQENI